MRTGGCLLRYATAAEIGKKENCVITNLNCSESRLRTTSWLLEAVKWANVPRLGLGEGRLRANESGLKLSLLVELGLAGRLDCHRVSLNLV